MALSFSKKVMDPKICSVCKNYLSCGPTKIYFNGDLKCGRCSQEMDTGDTSEYDKIAENLIFPCINRFEGCSRLLRYNETAEHEKTCIGEMYKCPLCDEDMYTPNSLLCLINHYNVSHEKSVLTTPEFYLHYNSNFENCFIYYSNYNSLFVIIRVKFDGTTKLSFNVSTVKNRRAYLRYRIRISLDGVDKSKTKFKLCTGFGSNVEMVHLECKKHFQEGTVPRVLCVIEFEIDDDSLQISKYQKLSNDDDKSSVKLIMTQAEHNILLKRYKTVIGLRYEDANVQKNELKIHNLEALNIFIERISNAPPCLKPKNSNKKIGVLCHFCDNYFPPPENQHECYEHKYVACPSCFIQGVKKCSVCKGDIEQTWSDSFCSEILYYCKFECLNHFKHEKNLFSHKNLKDHENYCYLNKDCSLTDLELGRRYFDEYYIPSSDESKTVIYRSNVVLLKNGIICNGNVSMGQRGKIYLITDNFKCIVFYEMDKDVYRFQVAHRYNPKKYNFFLNVLEDKKDVNTRLENFILKVTFKTCYFAVFCKGK